MSLNSHAILTRFRLFKSNKLSTFFKLRHKVAEAALNADADAILDACADSLCTLQPQGGVFDEVLAPDELEEVVALFAGNLFSKYVISLQYKSSLRC
jgi:hypothetical protein